MHLPSIIPATVLLASFSSLQTVIASINSDTNNLQSRTEPSSLDVEIEKRLVGLGLEPESSIGKRRWTENDSEEEEEGGWEEIEKLKAKGFKMHHSRRHGASSSGGHQKGFTHGDGKSGHHHHHHHQPQSQHHHHPLIPLGSSAGLGSFGGGGKHHKNTTNQDDQLPAHVGINGQSSTTNSPFASLGQAYAPHPQKKHSKEHQQQQQHENQNQKSQPKFKAPTTGGGEVNNKASLSSRAPQVGGNNGMGWGTWTLAVRGNSGVSAQQLAVVDDDHAIIYDKVEDNVIRAPNGNHAAWGAVYEFSTDTARALSMQTNSFCAGGSWLGNGTMASVGGNAVQYQDRYNDFDGDQAIRTFTPCPNNPKSCDVIDDPGRNYLKLKRWYPTAVRYYDGSLMIIGGCSRNNYMNFDAINQPSIEYYPPRAIAGHSSGEVIPLPFLNQTLNANLFPIAIPLPSGQIFMCARTKCMMYSPSLDLTMPLPSIPNSIKISYPMSGSSILLPLTPENNYTPEVMICGGSNVDDTTHPENFGISAQDPASDQCVRMVLTDEGISRGWSLEHMNQARHMHSLIMMPDGRIVIVNGAQTGLSAYGNVADRKGGSNADNPCFRAELYDPFAPPGRRFTSQGIPTSAIARMYHSTATITPSGEIMIAGSAPNNQATTGANVVYPTEWRVEFLSPPYINSAQQSRITKIPNSVQYNQSFTIQLDSSPPLSSSSQVVVSLLDPGFSTHGQQMNSRLVHLTAQRNGNSNAIRATGPPSQFIYPPGYGWIFVIVDGIPSKGRRVMIGPGTVGQLQLQPLNRKSRGVGTGWAVEKGWKPDDGKCDGIESWQDGFDCVAGIFSNHD